MRRNINNTIYQDINCDFIAIVGDIHGNFSHLKNIVSQHRLRNCCLICVGDLGVGFKHPNIEKKNFEELNDFFAHESITFLSIAGNHDDPKYFNGLIDFNHFKLLPDYSQLRINGKHFLFVGGAISIDRGIRLPNLSWWEGEEFIFDKSLAQKCDILVTHTAPNWIGPNDKNQIASFCQRDETLWDECCQERQDMNQLIELTQPQKHFCGHFHISQSAVNGTCHSRILNENEICEIIL